MPIILKRLDEKTLLEVDETSNSILLTTIKIPKNIHYLTDRLPKPNYSPLKTKKIDKQRFIQTLAGYKELEYHHNKHNSNEDL